MISHCQHYHFWGVPESRYDSSFGPCEIHTLDNLLDIIHFNTLYINLQMCYTWSFSTALPASLSPPTFHHDAAQKSKIHDLIAALPAWKTHCAPASSLTQKVCFTPWLMMFFLIGKAGIALGSCYGLNGPPGFVYWDSSPQCSAIQRWGLRRAIGSWRHSPHGRQMCDHRGVPAV